MPKLPARFQVPLTTFLVSVMMSCIVSGISTVRAIGLSPDFPHLWMKAWGISWLIAFPCLMVILPLARRVSGAITAK
jgi:hypothetical protein